MLCTPFLHLAICLEARCPRRVWGRLTPSQGWRTLGCTLLWPAHPAELGGAPCWNAFRNEVRRARNRAAEHRAVQPVHLGPRGAPPGGGTLETGVGFLVLLGIQSTGRLCWKHGGGWCSCYVTMATQSPTMVSRL